MKSNAKILVISSQVLKLIEAVLVFVIGLTLIINQNLDHTVSIILGVVLLLIGFAALVTDVLTTKQALTASGSVNVGTISLGLLCLITDIPLVEYLSLFLIVLGGYVVIEALLTLIYKRGVIKAIVLLVVGAVFITLGLLFLLNNDVRTVLFIIIGVFLLICGLLLILDAVLSLLSGLKNLNSTAEEKEVDPEEEVRKAVIDENK